MRSIRPSDTQKRLEVEVLILDEQRVQRLCIPYVNPFRLVARLISKRTTQRRPLTYPEHSVQLRYTTILAGILSTVAPAVATEELFQVAYTLFVSAPKTAESGRLHHAPASHDVG